jgi:hypothetical protein
MSVQPSYPPNEPQKRIVKDGRIDKGVKRYGRKVLRFKACGEGFWSLAIFSLLVCASCAKNPPLLEVPKWGAETAQPGQSITISFSYQGMYKGELIHLTVSQLNPDDSSVLVESIDIPLTQREGSVEYTWNLPESVSKKESTKYYTAHKNPYRYVVEATAAGVEAQASPELLVHVNYELKILDEQGAPVKDGVLVWLVTSDGVRHEARVLNGMARFLDVPSGPAELSVQDHLHKFDQPIENR